MIITSLRNDKSRSRRCKDAILLTISNIFLESGAIRCYHCSTVTDSDFSCSDELFDPDENLSDCSNVFDAQYCIKATGSWGGWFGLSFRYLSKNQNKTFHNA